MTAEEKTRRAQRQIQVDSCIDVIEKTIILTIVLSDKEVGEGDD